MPITDNGINIRPSGSLNGIFVTYFHLDPDNTNILYHVSNNLIYRTANSESVTPTDWTPLHGVELAVGGKIICLASTRGIYNDTNKLYIGNDRGQIFRLNDPKNSPPGTMPVNITSNLNTGFNSTISCIAVDPSNDNKVLAVVSNYNTKSIWYTENANLANPLWQDIEGNLSLPSVRSCLIVNKFGNNEYYVGTSTGLYLTFNINGTSTVWQKESAGGIKNAVVSSLKLRPKDNGFLAGTHGNGIFYAKIPNPLYKLLYLKIMLEGFYRPPNKMISDSVTVVLRNSNSPYNKIDSAANIADSTGKLSLAFSNASNISYYLSVKHRNSIETWSNAPIIFNDSAFYDFTSSVNNAYGNNLIIVNSSPYVSAIYGGDVDQNGVVDIADISDIDDANFNFETGYVNTDLNGDEVVDISDFLIADNNAYNFIVMINP